VKQVYLIAESLEHIRNWAKQKNFDLRVQRNIQWAQHPEHIMGLVRDNGYYSIITWPRDGEKLTKILDVKGYEKLPDDVNQWPIEAFN